MLYGVAFKHRPLSVFADGKAVRAPNPLMRVPVLVPKDGTALADSHMMQHHLDAPMAEPLFPRQTPRPPPGAADRHAWLRSGGKGGQPVLRPPPAHRDLAAGGGALRPAEGLGHGRAGSSPPRPPGPVAVRSSLGPCRYRRRLRPATCGPCTSPPAAAAPRTRPPCRDAGSTARIQAHRAASGPPCSRSSRPPDQPSNRCASARAKRSVIPAT